MNDIETEEPTVDQPNKKAIPKHRKNPGVVPETSIANIRTDQKEAIVRERDRIEGALPSHRRRSFDNYLALALKLGLERLAEVDPIVDPLADLA